MKDLQEKLAHWTHLYQRCQFMERLVTSAKEAHRRSGGPDPADIEAEYLLLKAETEAAFASAADVLKGKHSV